jgi:ribonuclease R
MVRSIPTREQVIEALRKAARPLARAELMKALGLVLIADQIAMDRRLQAMLREGTLLLNREDAFALVGRLDLMRGSVIGHADGFGFFRPEQGGEDGFISPHQMRRLLHGDFVLAALEDGEREGRRAVQVVEILRRRHARVVGRYLEQDRFGVVVPDDRRINNDICVPFEQAGGAAPGDVVVVEITEWPDTHKMASGRIVRALGKEVLPSQAIDLAIEAFSLPSEFSKEALKQAQALAVPVDAQAMAGREDLRALPLVTIDGEDARDFDDAVFAQKTAKGFKLIVAIADVASYVQPGTALDLEAFERGTSVYFPGRVIPMLPESLSNGMCSLKPHEDRLCLAAEMLIDASGETTRARMFAGVMRSHARLTYRDVWRALSNEECSEQALKLMPQLQTLHALFRVLARARGARGALEFSGQEVRFGFAENGDVAMVEAYERNDAHRLIEECMIAANVAAAKYLGKHKFAGPFRVHAPPRIERYEQVVINAAAFGVRLPVPDKLSAKALADAMFVLKGHPQQKLIESMVLRAQSMAVYFPECLGHFGLALKNYCHFTSPIRRYPDLLVHRAIHAALAENREAIGAARKSEDDTCRTLSHKERTADEAAREVDERLKCSWMSTQVGQQFSGRVISVHSFGAFVELEASRVQGMLHVTQLPGDYYHYEDDLQALIGERTGLCLQLGEVVQIKVKDVDLADRRINFALVSSLSKSSPRQRGAAPSNTRKQGFQRFKKRR